jgi:pilus assembly protein CpaB
MTTARIVVLIIALSAGGVAAYPLRGCDDSNNPAAAEPVAQLPTVDVLVAKSDFPRGQAVKPELLQWQTWPAATASGSLTRRGDWADAMTQFAGSIARVPFVAGEPILAAARHAGTLSLALRSITDVNAIEIAPTDQLNIRGAGVNVIRYGVAS